MKGNKEVDGTSICRDPVWVFPFSTQLYEERNQFELVIDNDLLKMTYNIRKKF